MPFIANSLVLAVCAGVMGFGIKEAETRAKSS